jgi:hypothetical protein
LDAATEGIRTLSERAKATTPATSTTAGAMIVVNPFNFIVVSFPQLNLSQTEADFRSQANPLWTKSPWRLNGGGVSSPLVMDLQLTSFGS